MDKHDRPYQCQQAGCAKLLGFTYSGGLLRHEREVHQMHGGPKKTLCCLHNTCKRNTRLGFLRNFAYQIKRVHRTAYESPLVGVYADDHMRMVLADLHGATSKPGQGRLGVLRRECVLNRDDKALLETLHDTTESHSALNWGASIKLRSVPYQCKSWHKLMLGFMLPLATLAQQPGLATTVATYLSSTIAGGTGYALTQIIPDATLSILGQSMYVH